MDGERKAGVTFVFIAKVHTTRYWSTAAFWCCRVFIYLLFSVFCFLQGVACCMQIEGDRVRFSFGLRAKASRLLPPRSQRQS